MPSQMSLFASSAVSPLPPPSERYWVPSSTPMSASLSDALATARVMSVGSRWALTLPQMQVAEYKAFRQSIFPALRGTYQIGGTHLLDFDATEMLADILNVGYLPKKNPFQLHQTPDDEVHLMLELVGAERLQYRLSQGIPVDVLEPSAGLGAIARAVAELLPGASLDLYELDGLNRMALSSQGFRLAGCDWLNEPGRKYDLVVMNPEFRGEAYLQHLLKAFDCLKVGGLLASVLPIGFLSSPSQQATAARNLFAEQSFDVEPIGSPFPGIETECLILYGQRLSQSEFERLTLQPCEGYESWHHYRAEIVLNCSQKWMIRSRTVGASRMPALAAELLHAVMKKDQILLPASPKVCEQIAASRLQDFGSPQVD